MHAYASETVLAASFASLHHLAAFALVAALAVESVLVAEARTVAAARIVRAADVVYGVAAGVVLLVGLIRVFYFEKGASYYFHTWTFIAKLTLFAAVAILSIVPTVEFLAWRGSLKVGKPPAISVKRMRLIRGILHLELVGVSLILLCAALVAKGIG